LIPSQAAAVLHGDMKPKRVAAIICVGKESNLALDDTSKMA
jgi:hypothetical protein